MKKYILLLLVFFTAFPFVKANIPIVGAEQPDCYIPMLLGKRVGLVVNQTSMVEDVHLVEFVKNHGIEIVRVFAPEHGFRGAKEAGEKIGNDIDPKTGIPIVSLYGKNEKPTPEQIKDLDVVVFDIQDVGCRFYTYISTLHLVMEACAEQHKPLLILDRPNPNGDYVDGPVLQNDFKSFVGMDPIALVHGCTIGELAKMIDGEGWLGNNLHCNLTIIPILDYVHSDRYSPSVAPSPNLPNDQAIRLYPSLCLFEATNASIGRGTEFPFQVIGFPDPKMGKFSFTPQSIAGKAVTPIQKGITCYGHDLRAVKPPHFTLSYILDCYRKLKNNKDFTFDEKWFNKLMGNDTVLKLMKMGKSEKAIRQSWAKELAGYKDIRKKYLLYPEK
ncbi:MAG: DUF1343 domain-containing protein [Bacteroidota bacterium]|nr:DUF1343 domain-containing protein [Bacteroidota bacterium]